MLAQCVSALFALVQLTGWTEGSRPPEIVMSQPGVNYGRVFANVGQSVKLQCPVSPVTFMEWVHKGVTLSEATADVVVRVEDVRSFLKINSVKTSDAGLYTCKVANGFGSVGLNVTLVVKDPNATVMPDSDLHPVAQPGDEPPTFTHPVPDMASSSVTRAARSVLRLRCRAKGKPRPTISWFVDGLPLDNGAAVEERFGLQLDNMQQNDAGSYMCLVSNRVGSINYTFVVTVTEPVVEGTAPDSGFRTHHPQNNTVTWGEQANFQCHVTSNEVPEIRWLKEWSENSCDIVDTNGLQVGGRTFLPVKSAYTRSAATQASQYLSKLNIPAVRFEHSGHYICLVIKGNEHAYRSAYLTVASDSSEQPTGAGHNDGASSSIVFGSQSATLAVVVAVPSLVVLLVAILIIYTVNKRKRERRAKEARRRQQDKTTYHDGSHDGAAGAVRGPLVADYCSEERASSGAMILRPGTSAVRTAATTSLTLAPAPPFVPHHQYAAYSCSDGSFRSFVMQHPYYGQQLHRHYDMSDGGGGIDSDSHFSSVSQTRYHGSGVRGLAPQLPDYADCEPTTVARLYCPPPPPPSSYYSNQW